MIRHGNVKLENELDYWTMESEDFPHLVSAYALSEVEVIGDPNLGEPAIYVLKDLFVNWTQLVEKIQKVVKEHLNEQ